MSSSLVRLAISMPAALPIPRVIIVPMFTPNVLIAQLMNSSSKSNGSSSSLSPLTTAFMILATVEKPQMPVTPEKMPAMPMVPTNRARASRLTSSDSPLYIFIKLCAKKNVICWGNCLNCNITLATGFWKKRGLFAEE